MKKFLFTFIILALVLSAGCSGSSDKKKPSEEATKGQEVLALLQQLQNAYVNKDKSAIDRLCTKEGARLIQNLSKPFDSAELTLVPTLIEMQGSRIYAHVSWQGKWVKGGNTTEERGMAIFVLTQKPMLVDNVLRSVPFKYPE